LVVALLGVVGVGVGRVGFGVFGGSWPVVGVVEEFCFGDVCYVFGWGEEQDGRGVEDCGGWEGGGGEDAAACGVWLVGEVFFW
jgi:hypothetical protein